MMAPVAAKLFIAPAALPVLLLLLHGSVLPVQEFQRLATRSPHSTETAVSVSTQ